MKLRYPFGKSTLVAALVLVSLPLLAAQNASVGGRVVGKGPIVGAVVAVAGPTNKSTLTDANGTYLLDGLAAGKYQVTASATDCQTAKRSVVLKDGQKLSLELKLTCQAPAASPQLQAAPVDETEAVMEDRAVKKERSEGRRSKAKMHESAVPSMASGAAMPPPSMSRQDSDASNTEHYQDHGINQWTDTSKDALSTFAVDVDTGAYTIARRKLHEGQLPPPAAVRTEEFVNYFKYSYPAPQNAPFNVSLEASPSPFDAKLTLLRVGLKGMEVKGKTRKPVHLTFLVDTSGSMHSADKIGLLKRTLRFLVDQLEQRDTVALCTYAGSVREVLKPTGMDKRAAIHEAIEGLSAGGSTAMASGLELAYQLAYQNIKGKAVNRVIVCSDGDANVGATKHGDMLTSIKKYAEEGITLSTIGFGMGNYKDNRMEQLANKGNGNYYYIDTFDQAKRVFGEQLMGTLQVIAKDVKIQVEFDPKVVKRYRLVGYENRDIADKDFRNDKVDAGEIGAGHTVTALYEMQLLDPKKSPATVRVRWKKPEGSKADEKAFVLENKHMRSSFAATGPDFKRAVAAAALAENLRKSPFCEYWTMDKALSIARSSLQKESPEEMELIELIETAAKLMKK